MSWLSFGGTVSTIYVSFATFSQDSPKKFPFGYSGLRCFLCQQAFDIADHFCEFTGVGSENLDFEKYYPKKDFQMEWLRSYMETFAPGEP